MEDIKKVIKELKWMRDKPTWKEGFMSFDDHAETRKRIIDNTLELLKEQEAVKPNSVEKNSIFSYGSCPSCGKNIDTIFNPVACGFCGKRVKWEMTRS